MANVDTFAARATPPGTRPQDSRLRRACGTCVKVKEKCVPLEDTSITKCQRCHRLLKDCILPERAPVRKRQRRGSANNSPQSLPYPTPAPSEIIANGATERAVPTSRLWYVGRPTDAADRPVSEGLAELSTEKKGSLFADFVNDLNPYFPFVVLDAGCRDAKSCEHNAPFTFAACIAASIHRQPSLQRRISREMLGYIGEAMLLGGKKSMDLVQGLNILVAWYMFHAQRNPQLMNLINLTKALLVDLGLTVPRHVTIPITVEVDIARAMHGFNNDGDSYGPAGFRALMMGWYIHAQIAVAFRRLEYPQWSEYLEDCLQKLQAANAHASDLQSIHIIRLYQSVERYLGVDGIKPSSTLPIRSYVRSFREDLHHIRAALPPLVAANPQFELHLQSVAIALYDSVTSAPCDHPAQMLEALHALLATVNNFFDLFLSQPVQAFPLFTFLHMSQASQATDVLAKLSFFQYEGWDLNYVRTNHNFVSIMERTMDKFEEVYHSERARFPDLETSRFLIYPMKLRQCKKWYEEKVVREAKEAFEQAKNAAILPAHGGLPELDLSQYPDIFGDQGWWSYDGTFNVQ